MFNCTQSNIVHWYVPYLRKSKEKIWKENRLFKRVLVSFQTVNNSRTCKHYSLDGQNL